MIDKLLETLRAPITVTIIFILFNLPQSDEILRQFIPPAILGNTYLYLAFKAILAGVVYFALNYILK